MAPKGNQQRNGADRRQSNQKKKVSSSNRAPDAKERRKASEIRNIDGEEFSYDHDPSNLKGTDDVIKIDQISEEGQIKESLEKCKVKDMENKMSSRSSSTNCDSHLEENPGTGEDGGTLSGCESDKRPIRSGFGYLLNAVLLKNMVEKVELSGKTVARSLKLLALSMLKAVEDWLERHRPIFVTITTRMFNARNYAKEKIDKAYPIALGWLCYVGKIILLLLMFWLTCTLRGIDSLLRMGTTSFFSVVWCSGISLIAMIGLFNFLIILGVAALVGALIGLTLALLVVVVAGIASLWFYGSFWTTSFVIIAGGLAFMLSHERIALLITTLYSVYSVWTYVGWFGLLLALNLSFISSDILIYFLKNDINWQRRSNRHPEYTTGMEGQPGSFGDESFRAAFPESGPSSSTARGPGIPSTSGHDSELTSEEEVSRLLNCTDHYSALGFSRYENVDATVLKREYRKKAMLVHPDKNHGNEEAAEAFKKLQNAYEVLFDSLKRKAYDDELRKEDVLNYFRRFQNTSQKNGEHSFFPSGFASPDADGVGISGDSRRIVCKRCSNFHVWIYTGKPKSQARWCQDCKEFHQAKDGDGWVEQFSQPFLFGLLQKVDAATAYVCADSKIYDATEWYICQGMRCQANTHKPSFHVNTSITSKHSTGKGSSPGQRSGRMPASNMEETMTEEELFELLQKAGVFDNFNGTTSAGSSSAKAANSPKSGGGGSSNGSASGSNSGNKRKKKGKKQW